MISLQQNHRHLVGQKSKTKLQILLVAEFNAHQYSYLYKIRLLVSLAGTMSSPTTQLGL